jgi:hypothetical protein
MRHLGFLLLTLVLSTAQADDSVRITYVSGYSLPGASDEHSEILVSRKSYGPTKAPRRSDIDTYFDAVRNVLDSARALPVWEAVPPLHADEVRVEILLGTRKHTFSAGYGAKGPVIHLDASESDQRHLEALRAILRLTTQRMHDHLLGETK